MNRLLPILLTIFLLFTIHSAFPQGIWKHYTNELPGVVFDMAQDKYGNYWIATTNGVCELDTNGFWHYLVDTTVWDTTMYFKNQIEIDKKNNKWFLGFAMSHPDKEYVVKYDDSTFTYYNPSGKEEENWISSLGLDSSDHIWAGSLDRYAYWFDGIKWHRFYVPGTFIYDGIIVIRTDKKGKLYFGHNNGLSILDGYLWGDFNSPVLSLSYDKDNILWFGTHNRGVGRFDGEIWNIYTTSNGLLANNTYVSIDSNQNIWVSYFDQAKGVSKYDRIKWEHFADEDGLLNTEIGKIFVDRRGAIWFAPIFLSELYVFMDTTSTEVKRKINPGIVPNKFILEQNFPNPFNLETIICYKLHQLQEVQLRVLNMKGEEVIQLVSGNQQAGSHYIVWNGKDKLGKEVSSGIYFYVLKTNNFIETKKMILIR